MDVELLQTELTQFLNLTELYTRPQSPGAVTVFTSQKENRGTDAEIMASAHVAEQIFDRVIPNWRTEIPSGDNRKVNRWSQHIEAARRAQAALARQAEIDKMLGDSSPRMTGSHLHPWVWGSARPSWQAGFFRHSVTDALIRINLETQRKGQRMDLSEADLFKQLFSDEDPKPGNPRLRLCDKSNPKTFSSLHRGVRSYAEGVYAAIRNPLSHIHSELPEDEALEQLAALSVLARWVDASVFEKG